MAEDDRSRPEADLEAAERALRYALDFLGDDGHLTEEGRAARAGLMREIETIEKDLEATRRSLRDALDFLSDDRHLTDKGRAAREDLLREIETIEQDLEAIRQEH
ncbi:MAG: hypothetical protein M3P49_15005, partial [Actinomycetota bacterium]|nr:hypothetical protein [Actinomycetota bacterium]